MGKSFKFRLQTILDFKIDMEEKEKEKLAKVLKELADAKAYKESLKVKQIQARIELKEKQKAGEIDINKLQFYTYYLKKLDKDILETELKIQQIKLKEQQQRQALLKAAQEKKAYEKLKEKQKEEFDRLELEKEVKTIDELATIKFARKMQEEAAEAEKENDDEEEDY